MLCVPSPYGFIRHRGMGPVKRPNVTFPKIRYTFTYTFIIMIRKHLINFFFQAGR